MTGKSAFKKAKWWEVSLHMQGGRGKKEVQQGSGGSDANAAAADGASGQRLINVLQQEKDFLAAPLQK